MSAAQTKKLDALIKRLTTDAASAGATPEAPEGADPLVHELIFAFLVWEAGGEHAREALATFQGEFVDYNEVRIGMSDELADLLPKRYPLASERCQRLRAALNTVFRREHKLSLASLAEAPKRESRAYLDSLEGMTPFVAARVTLLGLGAHAFPVDQRLVGVLSGAGACEGDDSPESVASRLERHYRAGQAAPAYLALENAKPSAATGGKAAGRDSASSSSRAKPKRTTKSRTSAS